MREKIELSGRDARWEFPKGQLFGRNNYMAEICGALGEMVEVVDDFFKFLGPELKAVTGGCSRGAFILQAEGTGRGRTAGPPHRPWGAGAVRTRLPHAPAPPTPCQGDTKGIDDVIERVQLMVEPVETALFSVFDVAHATQWRALRSRFYEDNEEVKAATVRRRARTDRSRRAARAASTWTAARRPAAHGRLAHPPCMTAPACPPPHPTPPLLPAAPPAARADRHQLPQAAQRGGRL
jgi:dynein heavy chain